jgi:hypothetical protein
MARYRIFTPSRHRVAFPAHLVSSTKDRHRLFTAAKLVVHALTGAAAGLVSAGVALATTAA